MVARYLDDNPNGSLRDIAGITNERGNVVGLMPHPEHAVEELTGAGTDGLGLLHLPGRRRTLAIVPSLGCSADRSTPMVRGLSGVSACRRAGPVHVDGPAMPSTRTPTRFW